MKEYIFQLQRLELEILKVMYVRRESNSSIIFSRQAEMINCRDMEMCKRMRAQMTKLLFSTFYCIEQAEGREKPLSASQKQNFILILKVR